MKVHTITVSGTYLAPSGPAMQSQGKKPGWMLSGAIVEAPDGLVFFKCVGPQATIQKAQADIDAHDQVDRRRRERRRRRRR